jgi:cytochrome P450
VAKSDRAPRPDHVPPEILVDFDLYDVPGAEQDLASGFLAFTRGPAIFWTPRNGGHWVVTRADDIDTITSDADRFSTRRVAIPKTQETDTPLLPLESEGERHLRIRRPLVQSLLPKVVDAKERTVRDKSIRLIEAMRPRGECEFVDEFAHRVPVEVFFDLAELPAQDAERIRTLAANAVRARRAEERSSYQAEVYAYLDTTVRERRHTPGDDLFSRILNTETGRQLSDREAVTFAMFVLFAGVDTTATVMTMTARILAQQPELRRELTNNLDRSDFLRNAVEEFIRYNHVSSSTREVARDIEYKGVHMKRGEMVQVMPLVYGFDEARYKNPFQIDLRRKPPINHLAFGKGAHVCPGAHLARRELQVFLQEWLRRIPDFRIKRGTQPKFATGVVTAAVELHLTWN